MATRTRIFWIGLGLVVLALALRFYGIGWGLPQVYEEAYPFKKSWEMWGWGKGHFSLNPRFFNYPSFFFYVQFLGQGLLYLVLKLTGAVHSTLDYRVLYTLDKTPFYLLGRSFSALIGAGTVLATLALGRRAGGAWVGVPAAFLVAINQMHLAKSQVIEVDVPLTLFATLCALYALRILERPALRHYLLAGLFGGLATSTKYSGGLLPLTILAAHLLAGRGSRASSGTTPAHEAGKRAGGRSRDAAPGRNPAAHRRHAFVSSLDPWKALAISALVFAGIYVLTSPYTFIDRQAFWRGFNYERQHMQIGHFGLDKTPAILFYLRVMTGSLLGWPLALLAGAGLIYEIVVRRRPWAIVLAVFPLVYLTLISSWSMKADRYILPLLPLAAIFASAFLVDFLMPRLQRLRRWLPAAATAVLVAVMAAPSLVAYGHDLRGRLKADTRTLSLEWIEANCPAGSFVICESYGPEPMGIIDMNGFEADVRERIQKEKPDTKVYALMELPMFQVMSQVTAPFYDLRLYEDVADVIVTSSSVSSRYRKDPQLYAQQTRFYADLEARFQKAREFGPADGSGPRITIYRNPRLQAPFSKRGTVPAPPPPAVIEDLLPGSIGGTIERFAFNFEGYGYYEPATTIYRYGLRYRDQPEEMLRNLRIGAIRCAVRSRQSSLALALLQEGATQATTQAGAQYWRNLLQQLSAPRQGAAAPEGAAPQGGAAPESAGSSPAPAGRTP